MIVVLMGVSACGKTTVGRKLVESLGSGWVFVDGDDFHPPENRAKMASGTPLTDGDRLPWLRAIAGFISEALDADRHAVVACSALKARYRHLLRHEHATPLVLPHRSPCALLFLYLHGTYELLLERIRARDDHYMKENMLRSQFEALEEPARLRMGEDGLPREPEPGARPPPPPDSELPGCAAFVDAAAWVEVGPPPEAVAAKALRWVDAALRAAPPPPHPAHGGPA
eukprot:tig00020961_g16710.t1